MSAGMLFLGIFIVGIGMFSFAVVPLLKRPVMMLVQDNLKSEVSAKFANIAYFATTLNTWLFILLGVFLLTAFIYSLILLRRKTVSGPTWGCGYNYPDASMQYTASSFAEPLTSVFSLSLDSKKEKAFSKEIFPQAKWKFHSHVNDWILYRVYFKIVRFLNRSLSALHWLQCGKAGVYVLYIIATLVAFIIWMFLVWE